MIGKKATKPARRGSYKRELGGEGGFLHASMPAREDWGRGIPAHRIDKMRSSIKSRIKRK